MRFRLSTIATVVLVFVAMTTIGGLEARADEEAAARQYRIARRLAAERSPQAAAALRKVVEMAPRGPLADDALLDEATLFGIPAWPYELGVLEEAVLNSAVAVLSKIVDEYPSADRTPEARYRLALLRMEPLAGQDLASARIDLLSVANDPAAGLWAGRSRFTSAAIDLRTGHRQRAANSLQRILVDEPASVVGVLARMQLAVHHMLEGEYGAAAALAQEGEILSDRLEAGGKTIAGIRQRCRSLRSVAVDALLLEVAGGGAMELVGESFPTTGLRTVGAAAGLTGGETVVSDRKSGKVVRYNHDGVRTAEWNVPQAGALTVDGFEQVWVAGGDHLQRIRGGEVQSIVSLDQYAAPRDLSAAATGTVWVLDRKGSRVASLHPGHNRLEPFWEGDVRLTAIAWDGLHLLGLEGKNGRVLELRKGGQVRHVAGGSFEKATALVSDRLGRFAVLDERGGTITLYGARGKLLGRFGFEGKGPDRPSSLLMYPNGGFGLTDPAAARVHKFR